MRRVKDDKPIAERSFMLGLFLLLLAGLASCARGGPAPSPTPGMLATAQVSQTSTTPADAGSAPSNSPVVDSSPLAPTGRPSATKQSSPSVAATVPADPTRVRPAATPSPEPRPASQAVSLEAIRLKLDPLTDGLDRPVFVTDANDGSGRLFIVEKGGTIRIFEKGQLLPRPFLDIRDRIRSSGSEQGLLGLAFSPDFSRSGSFFVDYTDRLGNTVLSRFRVTGDPNLADPAAEVKVLGLDQPAPNHNGGNLVFGPDGKLWVGTGDGGGAGDPSHNGQNPQTLLGKMLRIDVNSDPSKAYTIPADNPWASGTWNGQDVLPEIWAVGLRNPWRYSFDRSTGDLWIADVGQNKYEEIDRVPAGPGGRVQGGLNFGWSIMEGTHCFPDTAACNRDGLTLPVAEYAHGANGCSVTGGYVYRGAAIPGLVGAYLYGDYCSGRIWALAQDGNGAWHSRLVLESGLSISSFGEDQAGELYVADLQGGAVYRLAAG